uniref:Uncharacterized protein n=1 Tax=viral metagenome TaxID=1070528 RepID=A0A6M3L5V3_9ZZZZ
MCFLLLTIGIEASAKRWSRDLRTASTTPITSSSALTSTILTPVSNRVATLLQEKQAPVKMALDSYGYAEMTIRIRIDMLGQDAAAVRLTLDGHMPMIHVEESTVYTE